MDKAMELFYSNKLIVRAMGSPSFGRYNNEIYYDCSTWANEFELMQLEKFSSVSSTLVIPYVPVKLYKNTGYLVNSETADCFHICKTDSGSSGNIMNGDFSANKSDFEKISELAEFILNNNFSDVNEINLNLKLSDIVGFVVSKCNIETILLKRILIVQKAIEKLTGIQYPIYEYDSQVGKLVPMEITDELINNIILSTQDSKLDKIENYFYYTDNSENIEIGNIFEEIKNYIK